MPSTEQALPPWLGVFDPAHPAVLSLQEGLAAKFSGEFRQALQLYEKALAQVSQVPDDTWLEIAALLNLGNLHRTLGDHETSWAYYARAGRLARNHSHSAAQAHVAMAMAGLAWERGDYDTALDGYQEARGVFESLGSAEWAATALHNSASVYEALEMFDTALPMYRKVAEAARESNAWILEAQALCQIGTCQLGQGLATLAREPLTQALELSLRIGNLEKIGNALHNLGVAEVESGDRAAGLKLLQEAVFIRLEMSAKSPTPRLRNMSRQPCIRSLMCLVDQLCHDDRLEDAVAAVELVRAREMLVTAIGRAENLISSRDTVTTAKLIAARTELRDVVDQIESNSPSLTVGASSGDQDLSRVLEHYQDTLLSVAILETTLDSKMFEEISPASTLEPSRKLARHLFSSKAAAVVFLPARKESQLVVVTTFGGHASCNSVRGDEKTVVAWSELHSDVQECLAGNDVLSARRLLTDLVGDMSSRVVLDGFPELGSCSQPFQISLLPWGAVHDLPLEALLVKGVPIGLQWPVVRAFSLRQTARWKGSSADARALVIADPTRGLGGATDNIVCSANELSLPSASEEGLFVERVLSAGGWKVDFVSPENCSALKITELLASSEHRLIHFAGHVVPDPYYPERTGLLLRSNDGLKAEVLSAEALLYTADLRGNPLVVLSGCRSGETAIRVGDEPAGLIQAFLSAGASSVLATGWPVTDSGARAFMEAFYASIGAASGLAEAVLAARLAVYEQTPVTPSAFAPPEYSALNNIEEWAAFRLYGDR